MPEKISLKAVRTMRKKTLREVAEFMEVSEQTVWNWENEPKNIAIGKFSKLCEFYDWPMNLICLE